MITESVKEEKADETCSEGRRTCCALPQCVALAQCSLFFVSTSILGSIRKQPLIILGYSYLEWTTASEATSEAVSSMDLGQTDLPLPAPRLWLFSPT